MEGRGVSQQCGECRGRAGEGGVEAGAPCGDGCAGCSGPSGVGSPQSWANQDDCSHSPLFCVGPSLLRRCGSPRIAPRAGGTSYISQTLPSVIPGAFRGTATPAQGQKMTVHPNLSKKRVGPGYQSLDLVGPGYQSLHQPDDGGSARKPCSGPRGSAPFRMGQGFLTGLLSVTAG